MLILSESLANFLCFKHKRNLFNVYGKFLCFCWSLRFCSVLTFFKTPNSWLEFPAAWFNPHTLGTYFSTLRFLSLSTTVSFRKFFSYLILLHELNHFFVFALRWLFKVIVFVPSVEKFGMAEITGGALCYVMNSAFCWLGSLSVWLLVLAVSCLVDWRMVGFHVVTVLESQSWAVWPITPLR